MRKQYLGFSMRFFSVFPSDVVVVVVKSTKINVFITNFVFAKTEKTTTPNEESEKRNSK